MTDFSDDYLAARQREQDPEVIAQRLLEEYEARQAASKEKLPPTAQAPQASLPVRAAQDIGGGIMESPKQVLGGIRDAGQQALSAVDSAMTWFDNNVVDLQSMGRHLIGDVADKKVGLPEVSAPETTTGGLIRGVSQFLTGFIPMLRVTKAMGMGAAAGNAAAAAGASATVLDPNAPRVSDAVNKLAEKYPVLQNPITDYLAADPTDSEATGRFKNALEGLGLGAVADGLVLSVRAARSLASSSKGAAEAAAPALPEATAGKADAPTPTPATDAPTTPAPKEPPLTTTVDAERKRPQVTIKKDDAQAFAEQVKSGDLADAHKHVDFNFDKVESSDDIKSIINTASDLFAPEINKAKGGVVSFEQTKELADLIGMKPDKLNALYKDTRDMSARVYSARQTVLASTDHLRELAQKAAAGTATPEDALRLQRHVQVHVALQAELKGVQTEVARSLNAMKIPANATAEDYARLLEATPQNGTLTRDFANKIVSMTDPVQLNNFVRKGAFAKSRDALLEYWINGLLSSPATHAVNVTSNSLAAAMSVAERGVAVGIGKALRTTNGVAYGEVSSQAYGLIEGFKDALRVTAKGREAALRSAQAAAGGDATTARSILELNADEFGSSYRSFAKDEALLDPMTKFEHQHRSISSEALELSGPAGRVADFIGTAFRLPTRVMMSTDEVFKSMGYRMELRSLAYRKAAGEGLDGPDLAKRVEDIVADPPQSLHVAAIDAARYQTFTNELGQVGKKYQSLVSAAPMLRFITPFVRTPVNIIKYVGERTPGLNLMSSQMRADIAAGGARRDLALAKTATGGMLYALGASLAASGSLTGGGPKDKTAWKLAGVQPYSLKIGDKYYAYNRLDPFGAFLGLAADSHDILGQIENEDERNNLASAMVIAMSKNVVNKTYLQGIADMVNVIEDPNRYASHWLNNFASSFVPYSAASSAVTREVDPTVREVWTLMDAYKKRIPGWSDTLPPSRNLFGEPVHYTGGLGPDIASPIYTSSLSDDPVKREINRLGLPLQMPPKRVGNVNLSPQQYDRLVELAGNAAKDDEGKGLHDRLSWLVGQDEYKNATDGNTTYEGGKSFLIRKHVSAYRRLGMQKLMEEDKTFRDSVMKDEVTRREVLTGLSQ